MKLMLLSIVFSALVTAGLRSIPFLLCKGKDTLPDAVKQLGDILPVSIMAILVVYCLKDLTVQGIQDSVILLAAVASVMITHLWKRNTIFSVLIGTVIYMALLRI